MPASSLPLFPLPTAVLFPNVFLPLHIFETRYRQMVADALNGDRMIGMVLLKPGFEPEYEGQPPVYDVGCSGLITHVERLPDGRFNIVLRGLEKFRLLAEDPPMGPGSYRRGMVTPLDDSLDEDTRPCLRPSSMLWCLSTAPAGLRRTSLVSMLSCPASGGGSP
jgi:Lon protease-like protein